MSATNSANQNNKADSFFKKKIATRSFLLLISKLLPVAVQLCIIVIFSRRLSYEDYGSYQSIWLYLGVLSAIGLFGLPSLLLSASLKNITDWLTVNKKTAIPVFILLNLIPIVYLFTIALELPALAKLLLFFVIIFQNISILSEALAIKRENEKRVVVSNIIFSALFLVWHLYVLNSGYSLYKLLPGLLALYALKSILLVDRKNFAVAPDILLSDSHQYIGKQWFYLGINDVLGVLFKWLDKWVILLLLSAAQFAIYFNGAYEIPVFALMISAVGSIMLVELSKDPRNITEQAPITFKNTSLLLSAIVFPAFCFLLFYNAEFFTLFFGTKYQASIPIFLISIFVLPIRITNYTAVLQVLNKNDLIVKGAIIDICIAIFLMIILYPLLQEKGIALAFVISTYFQAAYYLWHTGKLVQKKISDFFPFKQLLLTMLFAITITVASKYALILLPPTYKLFAGILICGISIFLLLLYYFKVDKKTL